MGLFVGGLGTQFVSPRLPACQADALACWLACFPCSQLLIFIDVHAITTHMGTWLSSKSPKWALFDENTDISDTLPVEGAE